MEFYTVSLSAMDQSLDANPFWHTFLLLSCYDQITKKLEVMENWGFGGVPASTPYSFIRKLKKNLGLDTDLYGNHGMLYGEEIRHLERGHGLHAVTFELTKEKFTLLKQRCAQMAADQQAAIDEAVVALNLKPKLNEKIRNYPFEHESYRIYQYELMRAKVENRAPRLHEFSLSFSTAAHTCKAQALKLLEGIITDKQHERIRGWHPAITRLSGPLEDIYLHSSGPLFKHQKSSGEIVHYRKGNDVKLYWTLPPQEIETLSQRTQLLCKIYGDQAQGVKDVIRKLQNLEWFFRNAVLGKIYDEHRDKLVTHIVKLYEAFAIIGFETSHQAKNNWWSFCRWLTSQSRDPAEKLLIEKLTRAKEFLNAIYMAIVDSWEWKIGSPEAAEHLEVLAAYLTVSQQQQLCKIIGRNYVNPGTRLDNEDLDEDLDFSAKISSEQAPGLSF